MSAEITDSPAAAAPAPAPASPKTPNAPIPSSVAIDAQSAAAPSKDGAAKDAKGAVAPSKDGAAKDAKGAATPIKDGAAIEDKGATKLGKLSPAPNNSLLADDEPPVKRHTPSGGYYVECFLREVVTNVRRNPMMSIASISTVMVLALILGLFVIMVANLNSLAGELAGEMQIKVYMDDTFDPSTTDARLQQIMGIEHVTKVTYIPKDLAFARLRERLNGEIELEDLEVNPLPDAFEVPVDDPQNLAAVAKQLKVMPDVDSVDYGRDEAQKLLTLNKIVRLVGFIVLILLLASTVLIVSNTIRLTVFARRKEIDIMQLVGAADWFIRWPFVLEGVTQGLIGAGLAALTLDCAYRMVVPQVERSISFIPVLPPNSLMPYLCVGLIFMGCAVGAIGSLISVNRYLKA